MALEFLAMLAFEDYCGTRWPHWPWSATSQPDPPDRIAISIVNIYYAVLAGLITTTVATHPEEAFSLKYGPFALIPVIRVVAGLYYNNKLAYKATKVKM